MIRDPSDGTVREAKRPTLDVGTSGLQTDRLKAGEQLRLERSRDWLKNRIQSTTEQSSAPLRSPTSGEG